MSLFSELYLKKKKQKKEKEPEPANLLSSSSSSLSADDTQNLPPGIRLVLISDTHSLHEGLEIPPGDVLIHAGDFSDTGKISQISDFVKWLDSQPHAHRIYIAGNHDISLDTEYYIDRGHERFHGNLKSTKTPNEISAECIEIVRSSSSKYLQDEKIELRIPSPENSEGKSFTTFCVYGSPWQPEFCDWAFNKERGDLTEIWSKIPLNTDVLITHDPPLGFGDKTSSGFRSGCEELLNNIQHRESPPRVHIFGHIHEDRGAWFEGKTLYVNASTCTYHYRPTNPPICVHVPFDTSLPAQVVVKK